MRRRGGRKTRRSVGKGWQSMNDEHTAAGSVAGNLRFDFTSRTAIVTGAARGIGLAITAALSAAGASVYAVDADAEALARSTAETGVTGLAGDVSNTADVERVVATAVAETGRVDILVNNAGILRDKMLWKLSDEDWDI